MGIAWSLSTGINHCGGIMMCVTRVGSFAPRRPRRLQYRFVRRWFRLISWLSVCSDCSRERRLWDLVEIGGAFRCRRCAAAYARAMDDYELTKLERDFDRSVVDKAPLFGVDVDWVEDDLF